MSKWQRRLRLGLGIFVVVFAAFVYVAFSRHPPPQTAGIVPRPADPNALSEVTRGKTTQYKLGKQEFTLRYEKEIGYAGGTRKFERVSATVKGRDGRDFEVNGDTASLAEQGEQATLSIAGNVRVVAPDGLVLHAQQADYSQAEGLIRVPGVVEFERGAMKGTALGMTYDHERDIVTLLDKVSVAGRETEGQPPSEMQAGKAVWSRAERTWRFEPRARIVRAGREILSDSATLLLTEDEQHLRSLELRGGSQIRPAEGGAQLGPTGRPNSRGAPPSDAATSGNDAGLPSMRARDITLNYAPDSDVVQQALLAGAGSVEVGRQGGKDATRISGEFIDLGFAEDGATLRSLVARGANTGAPAELRIPAQPDSPARVVRAPVILGPVPGTRVEKGSSLSSLRFRDGVEFQEMQKEGGARVVRASVLDLTAQPGTDFASVDEAHFIDKVKLTERNGLEATARDARYSVKSGQLDLTGIDENGRLPQVVDERATIQGMRIVVTPDARKVWAKDAVQSVIQPGNPSDPAAGRSPGILRGDEPVYATADELDYDGSASRAVFRSKTRAKMWQARRGTAVYGREIRTDDKSGNLWATGSAVSTLVFDEVDARTKQSRKATSEGSGDEMFYEEARHRVNYSGHARIKGAEGDMTADRAILYLTQDAGALERLEAFAGAPMGVQLVTEGPPGTGRRTARGDRLVYTAKDEQYVMTGRSVDYKDECYETQGKSLTFFRSVGRIVVDGNESRTQTKGGQGCKKEPRSD